MESELPYARGAQRDATRFPKSVDPALAVDFVEIIIGNLRHFRDAWTRDALQATTTTTTPDALQA